MHDELRSLFDQWVQASQAKDVERISACYAADVVAFDAVLSLQFEGRDAYVAHWRACMEMCPGALVFQPSEVRQQASGDLGIGHFLIYCGTVDEAGNMQGSWMRASQCFRRENGQWLIVHEHFSAPFDPQSGKALFDLTPPAVRRQPFLLDCLLDAPREQVWQAWSQAERLARWWGPSGVRIGIESMAFRPGGHCHYAMHTADGQTMWGRFDYQAIDAPTHLLWLNAFSDAQGGLSRHPGAPEWPIQMQCSVTLVSEGQGTRLSLRAEPFEASEAQWRTFADNADSLRQGFGGTFEQLQAYLCDGDAA